MAIDLLNRELTSSALAQYALTPLAFDGEGVSLLQRSAMRHRLSMPATATQTPGATLGSTVEAAATGFFEGMLAPLYESDYKPNNMIEELANSIGHLAGFAGILPVGKLGKLLSATRLGKVAGVGKSIELMGQIRGFSVPMIAADAAVKLSTYPTKALVKVLGYTEADIAKKALKLVNNETARDIIHGMFHLGTASAVSSLRHGVDAAMLNFAFGSVYGGVFNAIGNYVKLGDPMAEAFVKTLAGSIAQGLPSSLRGDDASSQVYEYLLGAYFGHGAQPAHIKVAHEFIGKTGALRLQFVKDAASLKDLPGFKDMSAEARAYTENFWDNNLKSGPIYRMLAAKLYGEGKTTEDVASMLSDTDTLLGELEKMQADIQIELERHMAITERKDANYEKLSKGEDLAEADVEELRFQTDNANIGESGTTPIKEAGVNNTVVEQDVGDITVVSSPTFAVRGLVKELFKLRNKKYSPQNGTDVIERALQESINKIFADIESGVHDPETFDIRTPIIEAIKDATGELVDAEHPFVRNMHMNMLAVREPSSIIPLVVRTGEGGRVTADPDNAHIVVQKTIVEEMADAYWGEAPDGKPNVAIIEKFQFGQAKKSFQEMHQHVIDAYKAMGNEEDAAKAMADIYIVNMYRRIRNWAEENGLHYLGGRGDTVRMYFVREDPNLPADPVARRKMVAEILAKVGATDQELEDMRHDLNEYIEIYKKRYLDKKVNERARANAEKYNKEMPEELTDEALAKKASEIWISGFLNSISHKGLMNGLIVFNEGVLDEANLTAINADGFVNTAIAYNKRAQIAFSRGVKPRLADVEQEVALREYVSDLGEYKTLYILDMSDGKKNHLADSRLEENAEATDGSDTMPFDAIGALSNAIGLNRDAGAIKMFGLGIDEYGRELVKSMHHTASHGMEKLHKKHGVLRIVRLSSAKQNNGREFYRVHYNQATGDLELYDSNGNIVDTPTTYTYNIEDMRIVQTERIDSHGIADASVPKPTSFFAGMNDAARKAYDTMIKKQMAGDELMNKAAEHVINKMNLGREVQNKDIEYLADNLDSISVQNIIKLMNGPNRRVAMRIAVSLIGKNNVIEESTMREDGVSEDQIADDAAGIKKRETMMDRVVRLYGVEEAGKEHPDPMNAFVANYVDTALRNYIQNRASRIQIKNSAYLRLGMWDEWIINQPWAQEIMKNDSIFYLDDFAGDKVVRWKNVAGHIMKDKLRDLWEDYQAGNYDPVDKAAIEDVFEVLAIRVPQDSASGAQVLKFGGFTGIKGWTVRVHPRVMRAIGGADLDGDKSFIFFGGSHGIPKEYKDYFKTRKYEHYEKINGDTGSVNITQLSNAPLFNSLPGKSATKTMYYAGIGSRQTPVPVQREMGLVAAELEKLGYTLRSGGASGADSAFESGVSSKKEIYYAKDATDKTREIAKEVHPAPEKLGDYALNLMARNTFQVFGRGLDSPVDFVLAWTPGGKDVGGTSQAIRMARAKGIPVINLASANWKEQLRSVIENKDTSGYTGDRYKITDSGMVKDPTGEYTGNIMDHKSAFSHLLTTDDPDVLRRSKSRILQYSINQREKMQQAASGGRRNLGQAVNMKSFMVDLSRLLQKGPVKVRMTIGSGENAREVFAEVNLNNSRKAIEEFEGITTAYIQITADPMDFAAIIDPSAVRTMAMERLVTMKFMDANGREVEVPKSAYSKAYRLLLEPFSTMNRAVWGKIDSFLTRPLSAIQAAAARFSMIPNADSTFYGTIAGNLLSFPETTSMLSGMSTKPILDVYKAFSDRVNNGAFADALEAVKEGTTVTITGTDKHGREVVFKYNKGSLRVTPRSLKDGQTFIDLYFKYHFDADPVAAFEAMIDNSESARVMWARTLGFAEGSDPPIESLASKFVSEVVDYMRNDFYDMSTTILMQDFARKSAKHKKALAWAITTASELKREDVAGKSSKKLERLGKLEDGERARLKNADGTTTTGLTLEEIDAKVAAIKAKVSKLRREALDIAVLGTVVRLEPAEMKNKLKEVRESGKEKEIKNFMRFAPNRTRFNQLGYRLASVSDKAIIDMNNIYNRLFMIAKLGADRVDQRFVEAFGSPETIARTMTGVDSSSHKVSESKISRNISELEYQMEQLSIKIDEARTTKRVYSEILQSSMLKDATTEEAAHLERLRVIMEKFPKLDINRTARALFKFDFADLSKNQMEGFLRFFETIEEGSFITSIVESLSRGEEPTGIVRKAWYWMFPESVDRAMMKAGFLHGDVTVGRYYDIATGKLKEGYISDPISHFGSLQFYANKYKIMASGSADEAINAFRSRIDYILSSDALKEHSGNIFMAAANLIEKEAERNLRTSNPKLAKMYKEAIEKRDAEVDFDNLSKMTFIAPSPSGSAKEYTGAEIINIVRDAINDTLGPLADVLNGGIASVEKTSDFETIDMLIEQVKTAYRNGDKAAIEKMGVYNLAMMNHLAHTQRKYGGEDALYDAESDPFGEPRLSNIGKLVMASAPTKPNIMRRGSFFPHTILDPVRQAQILKRRIVEILADPKTTKQRKSIKIAESLINIYNKVGKYPNLNEMIGEFKDSFDEKEILKAQEELDLLVRGGFEENKRTRELENYSISGGFDIAKQRIKESTSELRANVMPGEAQARTSWEQEQWDYTPDVIYTYVRDIYNALHKAAFQAIANKTLIDLEFAAGEIVGPNGMRYTESNIKGMLDFVESYVSQIVGSPSISKIGGGDPALMKASGYHYITDETVKNFIEGIYKKLGIKKAPDYAPNAPIFTYNSLSKLGTLEAEYNLITLLFHPKASIANLMGGHTMTVIGAGFDNWRRARDIEWLRQNVNPEWKSQADLDRHVLKHGLIEDFLATHYDILKSKRTQWADFVKEVIEQYSTRTTLSASDKRGIIDIASKHGIHEDIVYNAAFFMRWAELKLRRDAGIAFSIQAWESFGRAIPFDDPIIINMAQKGIENSQFTYTAANRPMITSTSFGKVLTRFQMYAWNSIRVRSNIIDEAKIYGLNPGSIQFERFKRMMIADMFMIALSKMFAWSVFENAVPPHMQWASSMAEFFFGDSDERKNAFYGSRLGPLQIIAPPISRIPLFGVELLFSLWDGQLTKQAKMIGWSLLPGGRMLKTGFQIVERPATTFEHMTGIPIVTGLPRVFKKSERPDSMLPFM